MSNLLVTGGAGFIGANFVHYWESQHPGDTITVLDALTYAGNRANLAGRALPCRTATSAIPRCSKACCATALSTRIVHFAAESHVDRSIHGPAAFVETNVIGTLSLLTAAPQPSGWPVDGLPHRFHHVSTDEVYGSLGADDPAFSETTAYAPNSPYSASKAASDHLVRAWHHTYGLTRHYLQLFEQLRPVSIPRKADPAVPDQRAARPQAADLWRWHADPRLAARRGPLPRHRSRAAQGPDRRNLLHRRRRRTAQHHRHRHAVRRRGRRLCYRSGRSPRASPMRRPPSGRPTASAEDHRHRPPRP